MKDVRSWKAFRVPVARVPPAVVAVVVALLAAVHAPHAAPESGKEEPALGEPRDGASLRLEYGVTQALTGDLEGAEATFSELLSPGPNETAAWSNLGNVHLLRGEADAARDLYDRALEIDPERWGTLLNRSVARLILGDVEGSREDAARAMEGCGGPEAALNLLGVSSRQVERTADEVTGSAVLSAEDVRALLTSALQEVPSDSTSGAAPSDPDEDAPARSAWRAAGTRATGDADLARVLYWQY